MADIKITEIGATREEATRLGLLTYWGQKPCKRHHVPTMRYTKGQQCILCTIERNEERQRADPARKVRENKEYHSRPEVKARQYEAVKAKRAANPQKRRDEDNARYARIPEAVIRSNRKWTAANPRALCVRQARRRARKRNAPGCYSEADMIAILFAQGGKCAYFQWCGTFITHEEHDDDHIIPLSLNGSNDRTNMQCLCEACNASKSGKDEAEWMLRKWGVTDGAAWRSRQPLVCFVDDEVALVFTNKDQDGDEP